VDVATIAVQRRLVGIVPIMEAAVQEEGTLVDNKNSTISDIANVMRDVMKDKKYDMIHWNCHIAQQNTRKRLGLKVAKEYDPEFPPGPDD
jgi:hypothetical protein